MVGIFEAMTNFMGLSNPFNFMTYFLKLFFHIFL